MLHSIISGIGVGASLLVGAALSPFHKAAPAPTFKPHQVAGIASSTLPCVVAAVNAREGTLDTAEAALTAALNGAYTARASALAAAYNGATSDAIRLAVKNAWSAFASSTKSARGTWKSVQQGAWQTYATALKACKAPSTITDSANASLEVSGE